MKLQNLPIKGTSDWMPKEFEKRKYIFDVWRKTCLQFGYQEYLTPLLEPAEIYRAKSGEDVGGQELTTLVDRAGHELAIRPEMTPSVTRMLSRFYGELTKPVRLFSIANFFRNEKPQKGRNREFWQLNFDIFGSNALSSDLEVLQIAIEIMRSFGATKDMFKVYLNNRKFIEFFIKDYLKVPNDRIQEAARTLDRFPKMPSIEFISQLEAIGVSFPDGKDFFIELMSRNEESAKKIFEDAKENDGVKQIISLLDQVNKLGLSDFIDWNPAVIRGFDYYDRMVFEVFDKNPDNSRALFGGGRYNGLAGIFDKEAFPAVGCAPGDETTKIFLDTWNLWPKNLSPEIVFLPILDNNLELESRNLAAKLRNMGQNVLLGLETVKLTKALEIANKNSYSKTVIFGEYEKRDGVYKVKDMLTGEETSLNLPSNV